MNIFEWIKNKLSSKKDTNSTGSVSMPSVYWYCEDDAFPPVKAHPTDSGYDLFSKEEIMIPQGGWVKVRTGVYAKIENDSELFNVELQIRPKSGLAAKKGITVLNTPGTVDQGYTGEICVIVMNHGVYPYIVEKHTKIAQAVFSIVPIVVEYNVSKKQFDELSKTADRGSNGFGSTGLKK